MKKEKFLRKLSCRVGCKKKALRLVRSSSLDLVTVFDAILTSRQRREKFIQCMYENLMSNNFGKTAGLKKYEL